jgi:hypothetical protein
LSANETDFYSFARAACAKQKAAEGEHYQAQGDHGLILFVVVARSWFAEQGISVQTDDFSVWLR